MSRISIRRVAVLGAGVMGAQIAAHCVNAGVPVTLFDLPAPEGDRRRLAREAVARLSRLNPAPLAAADLAAAITVANTEDDLALLADCDLVIEAIAERLDWKHDLYRKVVPALASHAILASNTSGLPIARLAEALPETWRRRYCGVHFFNPPRYMPLVELIGIADTDPAILDALESFMVSTLGKSVVRALDTPNFIGNRVGVFSILATMTEAERHGLTYDVVDDITGVRLGRAKSGTFRTADVVGLDTLAHVIRTMQEQLPDDPFAAHFATPPVLTALVEQGALGQKTGAGFFRKQGRDILRLDPASRDYVPAGGKADDLIGRILKLKDAGERLQALRDSQHPQARFTWAILRDLFHYIAVHLGSIAPSAREVDLAMRGGFGHTVGPFELWQQAGWLKVAGWIADDIAKGEALSSAPLPGWVTEGPVAEQGGVHTPQGSWSAADGKFVPRAALAIDERQVFPLRLLGEAAESPRQAGTTVHEDDAIRLWHLDQPGRDRVLLASFKTKMHTMGPTVVAGVMDAVARAEADFDGLVVWQPEAPFSAGADLQAMAPLFLQGGPQAIEPEQRRMQDMMMRVRYAQVPVVVALSGMALGGGCELALAAARRVAALESYLGLVEVGVGLVPGAGGLAYGARRAAELHAAAPDTDLLQFLKRFVLQAATAQVSRSAIEARRMDYLRDDDPVVLNEREVLAVAIDQARSLAVAGYRPPLPSRIPVAGRDGLATLTAHLVNLRDGGFASEHDFHLARTLAGVMCGGDVDPGSEVDEAWLLGLERRAFIGLLGHPKTQERVMGMLQTGKPVRN
ncbi:MAG: 3-hydroxyacyl-CoA dehydrogenase/enoyl-CoA hydratase family protein [Pigmentiphaga sp.]